MTDDDDRDFADKESHSKPDRSHTRGGTFTSTTPVTFSAQDEFVITNPAASTGTHTFTFTPRGSGGSGQTFTEVLEAGRSCRYSGRGIQQVTIDTGDAAVTWKAGPRGTVFAVSNPSAAGGASSISHDVFAAISPNANATFQMGGLGSTLALTPKKSGVALVVICLTLTPATGDTAEAILAFGTGSAPALHAAATGTSTDFFVRVTEAATGINDTVILVGIIVGLTVGTAYWFDVKAFITNTATDGITANQVAVSELPN